MTSVNSSMISRLIGAPSTIENLLNIIDGTGPNGANNSIVGTNNARPSQGGDSIANASRLPDLISLALNPNTPPVAQGQALGSIDALSGGRPETSRLMLGENGQQLTQILSANPSASGDRLGTSLSSTGGSAYEIESSSNGGLALQQRGSRFTNIELGRGAFWWSNTYTGTELKNSASWYSESEGQWSKMDMTIYDAKGNPQKGNFGQHGCHATALLNAINSVAGTNVTPRNVRDYAGPVAESTQASRQTFLNAARKVEFVDIAVPGKAKTITTDKLFNTASSNRSIDAALINRIKSNVNAGNPVVIGIASSRNSVRHSAVITGVVTDKDGVEKLLVRDNWQNDNSQAKAVTLDEFLAQYKTNVKDAKLDYVWAARPR